MRKFTVLFGQVDHADVPAIMQCGMFSEVDCLEILHFADYPLSEEMTSLTDVEAHTDIDEWAKVAGKLTDLPKRLYDKVESITRNHWL